MQQFKRKFTAQEQQLFSSEEQQLISSEEQNDIMKIVQALEDSNILLKEVTKTKKKMKEKNKKEDFSVCCWVL